MKRQLHQNEFEGPVPSKEVVELEQTEYVFLLVQSLQQWLAFAEALLSTQTLRHE